MASAPSGAAAGRRRKSRPRKGNPPSDPPSVTTHSCWSVEVVPLKTPDHLELIAEHDLGLALDVKEEDLDQEVIESGFSMVANEQWDANPRFRDRLAQRRFNRNASMRRHAASRAYRRYLSEGGEEGNVRKFLDWLIANWDSIYKIIKSIIELFSGGAA